MPGAVREPPSRSRSCPRNCERKACIRSHWVLSPGKVVPATTREPGDLPLPALFAIPGGVSGVKELVERSAGPLAECPGAADAAFPETDFAMDQSAPAFREEAFPRGSDVPVTLHVCVTCLAGEGREAVPRPGRRLHDALIEAQRRLDHPSGFRIVEVECLSNCNRGCSVALSGPGRWTYVYGDLGQDCIADVLTGAERYAATADGLVPWRERPTIFRKGVIARIPPSI